MPPEEPDVEVMQRMMTVIAQGGTLDDARARGLITSKKHERIFVSMSRYNADLRADGGKSIDPPDNLY